MIIETKYAKERITQEHINALAVSLYEEMKLYFECEERRSEIQIISDTEKSADNAA